MPSSQSSKNTIVGIANQNYHSSNGSYTAPTTFYRLNLTEWGAMPNITVDDVDDEQDGSLFRGSPGTRLGIFTALSGGGRLRPANIGYLFKAAGYSISTAANSPVTGAHTHTITPVTSDASFVWSSFYSSEGVSSALVRVIEDVRLAQIGFVINRNAVVTSNFSGNGGHEEVAAGGETLTADTDVLIRSIEGSFSLTKTGGGSLAGSCRNVTLEIANEFPGNEDNFEIANHEFDWQTYLGQSVSGTVDVHFDKTLYEELIYGGSSSAGSGYDFDQLTGALALTVKSANMITGSTPYSLAISVPYAVILPPTDMRSSGRSELRMVLPFRAYKGGTHLATFTLINGKASYAS